MLDYIATELLYPITRVNLSEKQAVTIDTAERLIGLAYAGAVRVKKVMESMKVTGELELGLALTMITARLEDQKTPVTPDLIEVLAVWSLHAVSSKLPPIRELVGLGPVTEPEPLIVAAAPAAPEPQPAEPEALEPELVNKSIKEESPIAKLPYVEAKPTTKQQSKAAKKKAKAQAKPATVEEQPPA